MATYVALLRGINVGGRNMVPMAELKSVVESLGHTSVRTFIQSGNVIFRARGRVRPQSLEEAIEERFRLRIVVVLRTAEQLAAVVRDNPFADADEASLHVGFMASAPAAAAVAGLDRETFLPEQFAVRGSNLYMHLPNGLGRTKLPAYLDRRLKVPTTVRNWRTVTKLLALSGG